MGSLALVTGASSGIGEAFARALAARGHDLVVTARRVGRLERLARELGARHGTSVHVVGADLAAADGVGELMAGLGRLDGAVEMLINCAGFGSYGRFDHLPLGRELAMIDVNVRTVVALTGQLLPPMIARGRGAIVNIASTAAFQPLPYMATYAATKGFVLHFSEAIARECAPAGVRVLAVCPGHTPTEFHDVAGVRDRPVRTSAQGADAVVGEALAALEAGAHVVVTGRPNRLTTKLPRLLPRRTMSWLVERAFRPRSLR